MIHPKNLRKCHDLESRGRSEDRRLELGGSVEMQRSHTLSFPGKTTGLPFLKELNRRSPIRTLGNYGIPLPTSSLTY